MEKKELQAITEKKEGKLIAIASTEDKDRAGDTLAVNKWDFTKFLMNPVLQAGHDYRPQYTIGIAKNLRIEGKQVVFDPVFHTITPLAKQIKEMYEGGILKAWSVGYIPAADSKSQNELLEVSAVAVPANAYALMKGFSASDSELETEVKGWMDSELVKKEEEETIDIEEKELSKEDTETKKLVEQSTGETNGHIHKASFDDQTGNGTTDVVESHAHKIVNFKLEEAGSPPHTHTLDTTGLNVAGETTTPQKEAKKDFEAWNPQMPDVFKKEFDIATVKARGLTFENEIFTKFFDEQIKNLYLNDYEVPMPLLGSYLSAYKTLLADYELVDTRCWNYDGSERPPVYGTIQLNAEKSDDFLLDGTQFYKVAGKNGLAIKFFPGWDGMYVQMITPIDKKDWSKDFFAKIQKWVAENNYLKGEKFALSGQFIPKSGKTWDDVIADEKNMDVVKKSLKVLENSENKSRGLLFIGPPGTGKTMTGKVLMDNVNSTFIWVSSKDMFRIGSIGVIKLGFQLARDLAPSILFMEDIDASFRGESIDLLKTEMDGIHENKGVVTVVTSNYPEKLPDALLDRPGRFHEILNFDLPTKEIRSLMVQKWAEVTKEIADIIADQTDGYSGAHLKELVDYARVVAGDDGIAIDKALELGLAKLVAQKELIESIKEKRETQTKGFEVEEKEGRVISKKNRTKIEAARDALIEVLAIADKETGKEPEPIETSKEEVKEVEPVKVSPKKVDTNMVVVKALQQIAKTCNQTLAESKKGGFKK